MKYRIYPSIGVARVGNSPDYFVGPEIPGRPGVEIDFQGGEAEVTNGRTRTIASRSRPRDSVSSNRRTTASRSCRLSFKQATRSPGRWS